MGAYLSTPRTEKDSMDEKSDDMVCGASSMQGWRINQEDAHNCELNFDKDASFFAVYDGHGGPEIALYCSKHLPAFLKETEAYKAGDYEKALRDAFLGFDAKLLGPDVIEELKVLAGDKYGYGEDDDDDEDEDEDLMELQKERELPLEAVLNKYMDKVKKHPVNKLKDEEPGGSAGSSSFKPHSPCLRGKKQALTAAGAADKENGDACGSSAGESKAARKAEEEAVSSSSATGAEKSEATAAGSSTDGGGEAAAAAAVTSKPTVSKPMESPDSSSTDAKVGNSESAAGGSSSSPSKATDVSSSCSNGAEAEAGGSSSAAGSSTSSTVNGESSSSSSSGGISSTNVERAAKRVAMSLPTADAESDDSDEDEKDQTYDENNSTEDDEDEDDEEEDDEDMDDEEDDEEEDDEEEGEEDDGFISNMVEEPGKDSGCTAVVAFRHGRDLYVANAGDSRCVLSRGSEVIEMSFDHKPEDTEEFERIKRAGGRVTMDGRVNGGLNLSRAIGDHAYKMNTELQATEQMISAKPDIKKIELTDADDFMVLACDGIWNFMSSEAVVAFVKQRLDKGETKLSKICEELFDHCLAKDTSGDGTGCDNMTAIIVRFKWNQKDAPDTATAPTMEVGLKRAASSSPLPVPEIAEAEADGGLKAKRAKTEVEDAEAPTTTA